MPESLDNTRANFKEIAGLEVVYGSDLNVVLTRDDCAERSVFGMAQDNTEQKN